MLKVMSKPERETKNPDPLSPIARIFAIDMRIRKGNYPSQNTLAKLCGVSPKTLQRDLRYLQFSLNAPLEYDSSRKGWCYSDKAFFLPAQFASAHELQALLVLGETLSQYAGTPLGESMQEAFEMIMHLVESEDAPKIKRFTGKIHFASLPAAPIASEVWKALMAALQHEQRLEIEYRKGGSETPVKRRFDAYGLIVRNRDWYLYGYCHLRKHALTLAVPFISSAKLMDEYFDQPKDFDLKRYAQEGFHGLQSDGQPARQVVLRFSPKLAELMTLRPLAHSQKTEAEPSGHLRVSFETSALFQVEREVLMWGDDVEVLAPPELRDRMRDMTGRLHKLYTQ
jgi:predicted DNA-binding transcriptional regulator YafY